MYYTVKEVAELLRVSKSTVYRLAQQKGVPAIRIGEKILFDKDKLHNWLDGKIGKIVQIN